MRQRLRVELETAHKLDKVDRIILRQEIADLLNAHLKTYTVLKKELQDFDVIGPVEEL